MEIHQELQPGTSGGVDRQSLDAASKDSSRPQRPTGLNLSADGAESGKKHEYRYVRFKKLPVSSSNNRRRCFETTQFFIRMRLRKLSINYLREGLT
jgi:hypothetical protein